MKKILGLDIGTNSIGWALIEQEEKEKKGKILGLGSRIIPMSQDILGDFDKGNSISQTAERTRFRSIRRLRERFLLRRERLHRVLNVLGFLPEHYAKSIDFKTNLGKFIEGAEPKLPFDKNNFIFENSFKEMLEDFKQNQPELLKGVMGELKKVPYDWTIYYLRKKALTTKIDKYELAWLLLHFNQKRGYFQLRGEEEEGKTNQLVEFHSLLIKDVIADEPQKGKNEIWYSIHLENGWIYRRSSKTPLFDWVGKTRDFIVTTDLNEDGTFKTNKEGNIKRSFRAPSDDDWALLKKKTEKEVDQSHSTVGTYIYDNLLKDPRLKIKGKLVRTIERKFYKDELTAILSKQLLFHGELTSKNMLQKCCEELYSSNTAHQALLMEKEFIHLFLNDILFYQRPLRSKKSTISFCPLEIRKYKDENNEIKISGIRVTPKSNPYFQEIRLLQWMQNLRIYDKLEDKDITHIMIENIVEWENLFHHLNNKKEIDQKGLLKYLLQTKGIKGKELTIQLEKLRWNYVEDKTYPCNETRALILGRLTKVINNADGILVPDTEYALWHILYSVKDKTEFEKALKSFANKYQLDVESFVESFKKIPPFNNDFAAYSEKAIKKLLPLMRFGERWSWNALESRIQERIQKILNAEFDEKIPDRVREKTNQLQSEEDFQNLPIWLAQYVVYGRHSESGDIQIWKNPDDIYRFLIDFKQHSLRNPIVEQVVTETLRVVHDIWKHYGAGQPSFFDEIHVELGREMKNPADKRKQITSTITENENTNHRLKLMLAELLHDPQVENVRPYSPIQMEILKIYEEGVINSQESIEEDILKISKSANPTPAELRRYKLWIEQKYRSPYTGQIIPLNKLFTQEYEIEHIIPQSRYFDDSMSNKIICEAAVNKLKDNQLGLEFIKNHSRQKVQTGMGRSVTIFNKEEYEEFVKLQYSKNRSKRNKLLLEDIPDQMIQRQLNDTRYISKYVSALLSNLVRKDSGDDGVNSKNLIATNGAITNQLKKDWGLNHVWNDLILPRFERLNEITNSNHFTVWNDSHQKFVPNMPLELSKGFSKKRIDHRHHALDALVIASTQRDHINLLNNQAAKSKERSDLNRKLRHFKKVAYTHPHNGKRVEREIPTDFIKPWPNFTFEAKQALEGVVVSFKQNLRILNKATNRYEKLIKQNNVLVRIEEFQQGQNWAIRKPLHKDTVFGALKLHKSKTVSFSNALDYPEDLVNKSLRAIILKQIKDGMDKKQIIKYFKDKGNLFEEKDISRLELWYWEDGLVASRVSLDSSFDEKKIQSVTDTGIQKILLNHLQKYQGLTDEKGKPMNAAEMAFSPEGIEDMNRNIQSLNGGKQHQPIYKVRTYEPKGNKFPVGYKGNKSTKFVEAAKGTNLYFAIYQDETGKRSYDTIPLNMVIERLKQGLGPVPEENEKGHKLLFHLSPNDLVYVPLLNVNTEISSTFESNKANFFPERIYKFVSCTGTEGHFVQQHYASEIIKNEQGTNNKSERPISLKNTFYILDQNEKPTMIKAICEKLIIDRIGHCVIKK